MKIKGESCKWMGWTMGLVTFNKSLVMTNGIKLDMFGTHFTTKTQGWTGNLESLLSAYSNIAAT